MLKNKKIPGWVAATVIIFTVGIAVYAVPQIAKYRLDGYCKDWIDGESYNPYSENKILIASEYCRDKARYSRIIYLPPMHSPFGDGPRQKVILKYESDNFYSKRAPAVAVVWKSANEIIVRHEPEAEIEYKPGDSPTVLVSFEPTDHEWEDIHHRQHKGGSGYSGGEQQTEGEGLPERDFTYTEGKAFVKLESVTTKAGSGTVYYDPRISKLIQKKEDEFELVLETKLDRKKNNIYIITYSEGMSMDPGYMIYKKDGSNKKSIGGFAGEELYIPGNGNIYIKNSYNTMFSHYDKIKFQDGKLKYVKQPYQFVGMTSETTAFLTIYDKKENGEPIAVLPKGTEVSVLLSAGDKYLIKTPFGLLGWVTIKRGYHTPIQGLVFHGD